MHRNAITILTFLLISSITPILSAQEDLAAILDRGHPAQWYVCGPFDTDLPGGILNAVANDQRALGRNDFMASVGGILQFQPASGLEVAKPDGSATWILTRQESSTVDLSPFFTERDTGIAFAAFRAASPNAENVLVELHSVLGARVFLNGEELREIAAGPLGVIGVDQFIAPFQPGMNQLVLEVPGATPAALQNALDFDPRQAMQNRTNLSVQTGFEFDLRMQAVNEFGDIFFAPRLQDTGTFSGAGNAIAQDAWLTLFNPKDQASSPIRFSGRTTGSSIPLTASIEPIPPRSISRARIAVPISRATPGQSVVVQARLSTGAESRQWPATLTAKAPPRPAEIFFAQLPSNPPGAHPSLDTRVQHNQESLERSLKFAQSNPEYGFSLGAAHDWWSVLTLHPELRNAVRTMRDRETVASQSAVVNLDYRLATGETALRNWMMGERYASEWLNNASRSVWAWNAPYLPNQTAQWLADANAPGLIHNIHGNSLPTIYKQLSRDGSTALHRRKQASPPLRSMLDLHLTSRAQHRYWENQFVRSDLVVYQNRNNAPEPFWADTTLPLTDAVPAVIPTGDAADRYLTALRQERNFLNLPDAVTSRPIRNKTNLHVLRNPELQSSLANAQHALLAVELFATIASAQGTPFPHAEFEQLWHNILHLAAIDRLTAPIPDIRFKDYLGVLGETTARVDERAQSALQALAANITTQNPLIPEDATGALIVFNPSNWIRSDIVEAIVEMPGTSGLSLLDDEGRTVDFEVVDFLVENNRLMSAHIRFLAASVPGIGHRAWYILPEGGLPQSTKVFTPFIENEFYRIEFENGVISAITPKIGTLPDLDDLRFNELIAYPVESRPDNLSWNGEAVMPDYAAATVTMENTSLGQEAVITAPFLDGTVTKTLTLNRGVPTIGVQLKLADISRDQYVIASQFSPIPENATPILGESFGSIGGIRNPKPVVLSDETPELPAPNFSRRFHAIGSESGIELRGAGFVPFESALIIHTGDARSNDAVPELQRALIHHGIPSAEFAYNALDNRPVWQDDTLMEQFHDDFRVGTTFVILVGNPANNPYAKSFLAQIDEATRDAVRQHIASSRAVFGLNSDVPFGITPMPTLLLAGDTTANTAALVSSMAAELRDTGTLTLETDQALVPERPSRPQWNLAVLHNTPAASTVEGDTLTHYLYTPGAPDSRVLHNTPMEFEYAVALYQGPLHTSDIVRLSHGHAQPLLAVQSEIQQGSRESYDSLITLDAPNVFLTAAFPVASMSEFFVGEPAVPERIALRAYEHTGLDTTASMETAFAPYGKAELTPLGAPVASVETVTGAITDQFQPFDIRTLGLYLPPPSNRARRQTSPAQDVQIKHQSARPWTANHTPTPPADRALVVSIQDTLPAIDGKVEVTITNNTLNEFYSGNLTAVVSVGWDVTPDAHPYNLSPGQHATFEFVATRENEELSEWGILAQTNANNRTIFDARSTNLYPVEVVSERQGNEYLLTIRNRGGLPVIGNSRLLSSFDIRGTRYRPPMAPMYSEFTIPPYQDKRILYTRDTEDLPDWLTAKVLANGRLIYHDLALEDSEPAN